MIKQLTPILFLLFLRNFSFAQDFKFKTEEDKEFYAQMGVRTAKQTWWFFDARLKDNEPGYKYFRVFIEFQNVWLKAIKQLPNGKYEGFVDDELPHDMAFDASSRIVFDAAEIDDWIMVDDYYLLGGFSVRIKDFEERKVFMRKGQYRTNCPATNDDFFKMSKVIYGNDNHDDGESFLDDRFKTGKQGFMDFLQKNIYYAEYARVMGIQGYVTCVFELTREGNIQSVKVTRGVGGGLSDIARDVLYKSAGSWRPAKDYLNQTIKFTLPVCFKLH